MTLRHLVFTGPNRETSRVEFGPGLNVIFGASETGKSFVLESLDFMLGGQRPLRDIPERIGYDRVLLGLEGPEGKTFTLERAAAGGQFAVHDGLHLVSPEGRAGESLLARHSAKNPNNISTFLLDQVGLSGKRVRRDKQGNTNNLSFRNVAHLCLISEADIQKRGSPIEGSNPATRTVEMSTFKLILSGVDDSAVRASGDVRAQRLSRGAKEEVIKELLEDYSSRLSALIGERSDDGTLGNELVALDRAIDAESEALHRKEADYRDLADRRRELRKRREGARDRRGEIDSVLSRFGLLQSHYVSDLERLEGLREAGSLMSALSPGICPLCGAAPEDQDTHKDCDGNLDSIVEAADAEREKIRILRAELVESVEQLNREAGIWEESLSGMESEIREVQERIETVAPTVASQRHSYGELLERRTVVRGAINILETMEELEQRKDKLSQPEESLVAEEQTSNDLSTHTLGEFSKRYEELLGSWNVPEVGRVFFDSGKRDLVISGKARDSRGKGMRAITYAAFSLCVMEFALGRGLPHAGFVVLDSPLLAYREPEGEEDDLSGTDVQERFYEYLGERCAGQTVVLENLDPPVPIQRGRQSVMFSKNTQVGRYGLFPCSAESL